MDGMSITSIGGDYHFYVQLFGHNADVRDIVSLRNNEFASCSRDGTIIVWKPNEAGDTTLPYVARKTLTGHTNVNKMGISALFYLRPGAHPVFKDGGLVSAAYDKALCVWDVTALEGEEKSPMLSLWGHEEAPTSIGITVDGSILSGASDNTGRVWAGNRCIQILRGHKFPIWAIIGLANGDIVTGSGDRTIKIWRGGNCIKTLAEHNDAVRALTDIPNFGFVSASNDGTICLWTYDGSLLHTLHGHEGFVYKVAVLATGELVSASEDGTVKIWKENQCVQSLIHPCGIWSVSRLDNGDIITAGQDGTVRIWSTDPVRKASEELLEAYQKEILLRNSSTMDSSEVNSLPGPEALLVPGTKDNQYLKIKKNGKPYIYTWSAERKTWDEIGEIQGVQKDTNTGGGSKKTIDGAEYDFVFDVDLGDGAQNRKLTFNLGEDPYMAAQYFIDTEQLDQNFLDEIAKFIIKNVPNWRDAKPIKFVRGKKMIGSTPTDNQSKSQEQKIPPSTAKNFPQRQPVLFDVGNLETILSKIKTFNQSLANTPETAQLVLTPPELTLLEGISVKVSQTSRYHATNFAAKELAVIQKLLKWPPSQLFPVLDFLRLMVLHPEAAQHWTKSGEIQSIITAGLNPTNAHSANVMLTFRFVANLFMLPTIRTLMIQYQETLFDHITDKFPTANKTAKLTLATTLLNFSVLYLTQPNETGITQEIGVLNEALSADQDDDTLFILLVALGTLIYAWSDRQSLARDIGAFDTLGEIEKKNASSNDKIKSCLVELKALFTK